MQVCRAGTPVAAYLEHGCQSMSDTHTLCTLIKGNVQPGSRTAYRGCVIKIYDQSNLHSETHTVYNFILD